MIWDEINIPVIAVTGGIGSGKSVVGEIFRERGAKVIIADEISKDLLWNNSEINKRVVSEFGAELICDENGKILKGKLAQVVFNNEDELKKLNSILHPEVSRKMAQISKKAEESGDFKIVVIESAIVFESGIEGRFDTIVCVISDENKRISRLQGRQGTAKDIKNRIKNQFDSNILKEKSDYIIDNNGSLKELRIKTESVISKIFSDLKNQ